MRTKKIGRTVPPHGGNGKLPGGISIMRLHHKDGLNTDRTGKPVQSVNQLFICGMDLRKNLVSSTGGVKSTSPDTENHDKKWLRKII